MPRCLSASGRQRTKQRRDRFRQYSAKLARDSMTLGAGEASPAAAPARPSLGGPGGWRTCRLPAPIRYPSAGHTGFRFPCQAGPVPSLEHYSAPELFYALRYGLLVRADLRPDRHDQLFGRFPFHEMPGGFVDRDGIGVTAPKRWPRPSPRRRDHQFVPPPLIGLAVTSPAPRQRPTPGQQLPGPPPPRKVLPGPVAMARAVHSEASSA